ncbi:MAG: FliM/FliN family flagellar motor switch protein [Sedimentisphaerales bacterium]|nr:FliM/FliN family flagellar motor switch protein [Sedimentisphaerales bacterium]
MGVTDEQADADLQEMAEALEAAAEPERESLQEANASKSIPDMNMPPQSGRPKCMPSNQLKRILFMKVPVIVKIVQKTMTMQNILKLNIGSVIQFDKDAYELIDLMVNNSTIGLGQPVKIGEKFGIKITNIGEVTDTIKSLGASETE